MRGAGGTSGGSGQFMIGVISSIHFTFARMSAFDCDSGVGSGWLGYSIVVPEIILIGSCTTYRNV